MSASTHRPSPRSTLPAFPLQRRSRSPPGVPPPSSSHLRHSLSPKGVRLPPIQSLDFTPRPAPRESIPSQPLGTPLQDHYPHSSDPQFSSRNLKRAAASSVGSDVGQSPYKKRRTDDLNDIPQHNNSHVSAIGTPGAESHGHSLAKKGHNSRTPKDHPPLNNQRSTSPNPADPRPGLLSRASSSSARTPSHSREPSWQQQGTLPPPQQPPVPPKLERPSPPHSLGLASAAPTTQYASFSHRLSQSASGHRTTSRKLPPSHLTLHPQGSQQSAARSLQPAIQSAPPIPVHGGPPNMVRPLGPWIADRPRNNVHIGAGGGGHPSVVGVPNASISTTNNILNAEAVPAPAIRSTARHGMVAYPALPTPTSLRLGALQQQQQQQLHPPQPPLQTSANPNAALPNSPYGYRGPLTPAVPSPLPVLGSGAGVSDKAKFMTKMSEIYDRATSHRNCVSIEEVDRRVKEATNGLQQETLTLRKEVEALRKLITRKERSVEIGEGDVVDVNMEPLPPLAGGAGERPAATLKGPVLPELPRIEPPTPQSERPSASDGLVASMNGRVATVMVEKGKEKERDSPKDMTSDKETPPK